MDSHADSPVVGKNAFIISTQDKKITVNGFTDALGSKIVPVVDAAVAYDCEFTGRVYILIIRNALYFEEMNVNLIAPFILRLAGLKVNEEPKFMATNPTLDHHSISIPNTDIKFHMAMKGIISYLPTRRPTSEEMTHRHLNPERCIELTPGFSEWNPHNPSYGTQENAMIDYHGDLILPRKISAAETEMITLQDNQDETIGARTVIGSVSRALHPSTLTQDLEEIYGDSANGLFQIKDGSFEYMVCGVASGTRHGPISVKQLVRKWGISEDMARSTLLATTQRLVRSLLEPSLNKRFNTNDKMLRYHRISCDIFMDTFFAAKELGPSTRGNTCAQLFVSDFGFIKAKLMKLKSEVPLALKSFFKNTGVPNKIICDGAPEQVKGESRKLCNACDCHVHQLERGTPWANRSEGHVGIIKSWTKTDLKISNAPMVLWDYAVIRRANIMSSSSRNLYELDGQVPNTKVTGQQTDISSLAAFEWYEWVYYRDPGQTYPFPSERLGRCLGPAEHHGTEMSQWVLNEKGNVLPQQTLRSLTPTELQSNMDRKKRDSFDKAILEKLGDSLTPPSKPIDLDADNFEPEDKYKIPDADDFPEYDKYLNAEVILPRDGERFQSATVIRRATRSDGRSIGGYNSNPILDTRIYEVMFNDGSVQEYAANRIALSMYDHIDEAGHRTRLLDSIGRHRSDGTAVDMSNGYTKDSRGRKTRRITTKGWDFLAKWRDGSESWIPLCDLKESNPIEVAEYALANKISKEPAFAWWTPHTLKKRNQIVSAVQQRVKIKDNKYGIKIPKNLVEAYAIDRENNNTIWRDAIRKEMKNVSVAFEVLEDGKRPSPQHKFVRFHLVFDVKMDFTRKARLVAEGCNTPDPVNSTFAGVVSRESVRIAFTYAALNDLDVWAGDIQNAYLQAPCSEKYYTVMGKEFGSEFEGKKSLITRAAYGLKSAGADFRNHLRDCMKHLGYTSCLADPDVWMRPATRGDGLEYYEFILLYVDDILCVSANPKSALLQIDKYFPIKPDSLGPPKVYLGGKVSQVILPNGVKAFSYSASQYLHEAIRGVEEHLAKQGMKLSEKKAATPLPTSYHPELDVSPELVADEAAYYQSLIGILRWIVELGRIDITGEVSKMSSHLCLPREGQLDKLFYMFGYLKHKHTGRLVFDPTYPTINYDDFPLNNWSNFYGDTKEVLPPDAPEPRGKGFEIVAYVDADLAGNKVTRSSRTGFIIFLNQAPIYWFSKRQNGVESSTFGSEFVAMKQCCEYIRGLRYKLRMMGIQICGPAYVYGDNQSVLSNTSCPESKLSKKHHSIAYHVVREGVARNEWLTGYVKSENNSSDTLTKTVPAGEKRDRLVSHYLWDMS